MNIILRHLSIFAIIICFSHQTIAQDCTAAFTVGDTDLTIQFTDQSTSLPGDPIVSWFWDFDDGSTSTQQNPLHTFGDPDDKYDVELVITTQNGCTADVEIRIEICVLTLNVNVGSCDSNGNIPLTVNVSDVYDNAKEINIAIDGNLIPGSPFDIQSDEPVTVNTSTAGDGLQHVLTVQSDDIGTCNNSFTFTVPDCNSNCFLSAFQVGFSGGATHTINVGTGGNNVFTPNQTSITVGDLVNFQFVDNGHTTTSDANNGLDVWNSGELGVGSTYPVTIQNPGVHSYYCIPHGGPGGSGMSGTIIANCPGGNNFDLELNFNTTQANPGGFNVQIDGVNQPGSPFPYNGTGAQTVTIPIGGDGATHTIEVIDVDDPTCVLSNNFAAPDCGAAPTCNLSLNASQTGGCDGNNNVNVEVIVTSINGGAAGFNLAVDGTNVAGSPFSYDGSGTTTVNIDVFGDGQSHTITATDANDGTCTGSTTITTSNCTIPCSLTNLSATAGANTTQVVLVEDFQFTPENITISAGDIVEWQWTGQIDHTSTSDVTSGPDSWESGLLGTGATYQSPVLSAGVHPYYCIPHGAPGGVGMAGTITVQANCTNGEVAVSINFDESGGGFNGFNVLIDGAITANSPIAYDPSGSNSVSEFIAGDGQSHTIQIQDVDDPSCTISTNITTPDCNAPTCQLTASAVENGGCDANDNVPVDVTVSDVGGGANGFTISVDGQNVGSFSYSGNGTTTVSIDVIGDGQSHSIEIIDADDANCNATTNITTTNCVIPCNLTNLNASSGGGGTQVVLVEDFVFNPENITITAGEIVEWQWVGAIDHTATSDATSGPDSWDSGLLGTGATYQSPVLSAGVHPYYCIPHGAPGGVGMAGTITVQADCTNGMVSVNLTFSATGGGFNGFDVLVDGNFNSNHAYIANGNNSVSILIPGDGQSHSIEIQDTDDTNCTISTNITTPDCNAPTCQLTASAVENGGCDANDNVPVDVTVSDVGGGANGFTISVDGQNVGSFSYSGNGTTTVSIDVIGDGQSHSIEIIDADDANCNATTNITTTNCVIPCNLTNLNASSGGGGTQIVLVEDFVFNPENITITAGEIVEWQWVGAVDHTATSDATSGADAFDSGLLGTGATFQSPVLSAGVHPYYCIPHGAPGGVGMAGTITVQANCTNGMVSVNLTFDATGGGFNGFDVLVDGNFNSNHAYAANGNNSVSILIPGDGLSHSIEIQDTDDLNCTISTSITTPDCNAPTCQLTASAVENGGCDANDNVPVDITVNDVGGGTNGFTISVDGQNVGSFSYSGNGTTTVSIDVIGDGQSHAIEIIDADDPNCNATTSVTTTNCVIPCNLTNLTASSGGGGTQIVLVEDFVFNPENITITAGEIVEWQWVGAVDHTATSDATSGADSFDSGLLGTGATFQSPVLSAGVHPYYCIPHGAPGGVGMAGTITVQANCTNGMVSVNLTFDATGGGFNGFDVLVDGNFNSNHAYAANGNNSVSILIPGDGLSHSIEIQDTDDTNCTISTNITTPDCNAPTCQLTASAVENGGCDANDNVPVDVTISDVGGSANGFSISVDGQNVGSFSYSGNGTTIVSIDIIGDGQNHVIEIIDADDANCNATTSITTTNCVIPCNLTNLTASSGGGGTQVVLVEDFVFNPENITITAGETVEWQWVGAVDHTATSDATSGADSFDSGLLGTGATFQSPVLSAGVHPYYCIPHGAPGGVGMAGTITVQANCTNGMVSVNLTFNATGGGFNGFDVLVDGNFNSNHAYAANGNNSVSILISGDGQSHTIEIQDTDDANCTISTSITTPDCNAPTCQLTASAVENGGCDANDNVPVDVTISDVGGSANGFTVSVDGQNVGSFSYSGNGTTTVSIDVIGDGQSHSIEIIDADDANCNATTLITTTNCTISCSFSNLNASTGNSVTETILVEDFVFNPVNLTIREGDIVDFQWTGQVDHTSTSDTSLGDDVWDSGLLGNGANFQVTDLSLGNHPYYCIPHGAPGGVGMAGTITVVPDCDANNQVAVNLTFNATGGSFNGFNVLVDGNLAGNFNYATNNNNSITINIDGDGQNHSIEIQDSDDANCSISTNIFTPDCSFTPPCELTLTAAQSGNCDANNQVNVELTVTNLNTGQNGFNVLVDGNSVGNFVYDVSGTTVSNILIIGDGQNHSIEIQDADDATCTASTTIITQSCQAQCALSDLSAATGNTTTHTVEVRDFDFFPPNLTINEGDIIDFQWTGAVAHTSTSDATSGDDVWESGLLENGASFQVADLSLGNHPYYCIPHGAPGGVGMAGMISVVPDCDNGQVAVTLSFTEMDGGLNGYNILIDNVLQPNSPFNYSLTGSNEITVFADGDGQIHTFEIQDSDNSDCNITLDFQTPDCSFTPPCELNLTAVQNGNCDANDEVSIQLSVENANAGNAFNLTIDGNNYPQNPVTYDPTGTTILSINLNGDGQNHFFEITDTDSTNCTASANITIEDCSTPCQFSNLALAAVGGNNPTTHPVEVKDFEFVPKDLTLAVGDVVNFQWTGAIAHTATSDDSNHPDAFDSGLLNQGDNFQVTITNEGFYPYYCIPHGTPGGVGMAGTITATLPLPSCDANGQVTVSIDFQAVGTGNNGFVILIDGVQNGGINPYTPNGMNTITVQIDGDGQAHSVEIQDADNANCSISESIIMPDCNTQMACELSLSATQISDCDANDSIGVELNITSHNAGASGFNLLVDGNLISGSPYFYDASDTTILTLNLAGNGLSQNLEIVDLDSTNCNATFQIATPNCFDFCQILNLETSANSSSKHFVEVKEFEFLPANLDILVGDTVQFFWTGAIAHTSTSDAISGANSWDSGLLMAGATFEVVVSEAGAHPFYCIPHGGPGGIGQSGVINALEPCMDSTALITINFDAHLGSNTGYNVFLDGQNIAGPLAYDNPNGANSTLVSVPADGMNHLLTVGDIETGFCAATIQFTTPDCEVVDCNIANLTVDFPENTAHTVEVKDFEFLPKDIIINLGDTVHFVWTGAIPHTSTSDATMGVDSWESGLLGQGETFDLVIENTGFHPYYCIPHGGPNGIGMAGTITVEDNNCQNGLVQANVSFTNAGTGSEFNVFVDGNLTPDSPLNYDNGTNDLLLSLPGDGDLHTIIVADFEDANCADTVSVVTENCDLTCSLSANFEQMGDCDVNEEVTYELTISNENSGSSFNLNIDGNGATNFAYDPSGTTILEINLPGDNALHSMEISDADSTNCAVILEIMTPDCASPNCEINLAANQAGSCDADGNVPYELMVNVANNGGAGFQIFVDGVPFSADPLVYNGQTTTLNTTLLGDGQNHIIVVTDLMFLDCADTISVTTPNCTAACNLTDLEIDFNTPQTHIVDVLDFEFEPKDITVNIGDTVRFDWIGVIPHTATSDATSGNNVFNSGLLGEGAVFDVVISAAGFHSYYCIPHGAPGGIGMAGTITAVDDCDDGVLNLAFNFIAENGGFSGYDVLIDGNFENNFAYATNNQNLFDLNIPGNGQSLNLTIQDAEDATCLLDTMLQMPNCSDPCFGFSAAYDTDIDHINLVANFTSLTPGAISWLWTFGDGAASTLENPTHTYDENGTYEICLTVEDGNGCEDQFCEEITVGQYLCEPNFSFELDGLTLSLFDESVTTESIDQWTWALGDMSFIVGQENPVHTYDSLGEYTICLTIDAGVCHADTCMTLDLTDPCLAFQPHFDYVVDHVNLGVQFLDQTTGNPNQWLWGFGDANTSNNQNPEHFYNQMGNYNVCLLVQDTDLGCNKNYCEVVQVGTVATVDLDIRNFDLKIYPSPSPKGNQTWTMEGILSHDFYQNLELRMYDVQGRTVVLMEVMGAESVVFTSDGALGSGVYFVEMRSGFGVYRGKVLVE